MRTTAFSTPRAIPARGLPILAGGLVIVAALPVFLLAGWRLGGWALAAVLWIASQVFGLLLARLQLGAGHLAGSGIVGVGMSLRAIAVMVVVIAVAASDAGLGLAAGLVYALAYTVELAFSLASYFGSEPLR